MSHRSVAMVRRPAQDVVRLLAFRPAGWLRGFLQLALNGRSVGRAGGRRPWYRVSQPVESARGVTSFEFTWWPHVTSSAVFDRFHGRFIVQPVKGGTQLILEGETEGGRPATNEATLDALVKLLAAALSGDQESAG